MVERWLAEISGITSESTWYASVSHPLERIMEYDLDCRKINRGGIACLALVDDVLVISDKADAVLLERDWMLKEESIGPLSKY